MKVFGLTGGVGMGKSTAGAILTEEGVAVLDTDEIARELVAPGGEILARIAAAFGEGILEADGTLSRSRLAARVFSDTTARRQLESILHPPVRAAWQARVETWRAEGIAEAAVVIPLLFETGAESFFFRTLCLACGAETQRSRLLSRGWSEAEIRGRIAAQWPIGEKIKKSDVVLWSEGSLLGLKSQIKKALRRL